MGSTKNRQSYSLWSCLSAWALLISLFVGAFILVGLIDPSNDPSDGGQWKWVVHTPEVTIRLHTRPPVVNGEVLIDPQNCDANISEKVSVKGDWALFPMAAGMNADDRVSWEVKGFGLTIYSKEKPQTKDGLLCVTAPDGSICYAHGADWKTISHNFPIQPPLPKGVLGLDVDGQPL
jgi:hypothetical protein